MCPKTHPTTVYAYFADTVVSSFSNISNVYRRNFVTNINKKKKFDDYEKWRVNIYNNKRTSIFYQKVHTGSILLNQCLGY